MASSSCTRAGETKVVCGVGVSACRDVIPTTMGKVVMPLPKLRSVLVVMGRIWSTAPFHAPRLPSAELANGIM